uniref:Uncharacterized protein n=1 Tax=Arundo donax TaxID=35708 RepID=A0A0A8ZXU3_ARUDO
MLHSSLIFGKITS